MASLPRPAFVDARDDPWAFGDRLAWEDAAPLGDPETLEVIDRLRTALAPVTNCLRQLIAYRAFCRADVSATPVAAPRVSD